MQNKNLNKCKKSEFLLGNEAIAKGALNAGVRFISCYPGTPSSEVVETLLSETENNCDNETLPDIEYSINEKVAFETACGASLAGSPSMVTMKHVGVNVAADPIFTTAYLGTPGGLLLLSADDPGCHSSQNEQDNRYYARAASLPCFEPASSQEAYDMTVEALHISQELEHPVMLRTVTRVNHSRSPVKMLQCKRLAKKEHRPAGLKHVPVPMVARMRHEELLKNLGKAREISENSRFNNVYLPETSSSDNNFGIIVSGIARSYVKDALVQLDLADKIAILELGMTWPLPVKKISDFMARCKNILVMEEGEKILEKDIAEIALNKEVTLEGKNTELSVTGELSTSKAAQRIQKWLGIQREVFSSSPTVINLPKRAPNLCPGCAHRSVYYAVRKVFGDNAVYSSDIGCYTLGLMPPLKTADFALCMGSSISAGAGFAQTSGLPVVAFIGDSTFFHSGMTGLANAVYNRRNLLLVILDNGTTAMTGHQPHPGMAQEALGNKSLHLDIEGICRGMGVTNIKKIKSHNLSALIKGFEELGALAGVRVLIAQEPCLLFGRSVLGKKKRPVAEVISQCEAGEKCLHELACPAFTRKGNDLAINEDMCGGCMICVQIAPEAFKVKKSAC